MSETRLKIFVKFVIEDQINLAAETSNMEYLGILTDTLLEFGNLSDMAQDIASVIYYCEDYKENLKENNVCDEWLYGMVVDILINYINAQFKTKQGKIQLRKKGKTHEEEHH